VIKTVETFTEFETTILNRVLSVYSNDAQFCEYIRRAAELPVQRGLWQHYPDTDPDMELYVAKMARMSWIRWIAYCGWKRQKMANTSVFVPLAEQRDKWMKVVDHAFGALKLNPAFVITNPAFGEMKAFYKNSDFAVAFEDGCGDSWGA
jgi:hypothetical protein